jgi:hypothetical protein
MIWLLANRFQSILPFAHPELGVASLRQTIYGLTPGYMAGTSCRELTQ